MATTSTQTLPESVTVSVCAQRKNILKVLICLSCSLMSTFLLNYNTGEITAFNPMT